MMTSTATLRPTTEPPPSTEPPRSSSFQLSLPYQPRRRLYTQQTKTPAHKNTKAPDISSGHKKKIPPRQGRCEQNSRAGLLGCNSPTLRVGRPLFSFFSFFLSHSASRTSIRRRHLAFYFLSQPAYDTQHTTPRFP